MPVGRHRHVDAPTIAEHVANKGGPPEYVAKNQERLVAVARMLGDLAAEQRAATAKK